MTSDIPNPRPRFMFVVDLSAAKNLPVGIGDYCENPSSI